MGEHYEVLKRGPSETFQRLCVGGRGTGEALSVLRTKSHHLFANHISKDRHECQASRESLAEFSLQANARRSTLFRRSFRVVGTQNWNTISEYISY